MKGPRFTFLPQEEDEIRALFAYGYDAMRRKDDGWRREVVRVVTELGKRVGIALTRSRASWEAEHGERRS